MKESRTQPSPPPAPGLLPEAAGERPEEKRERDRPEGEPAAPEKVNASGAAGEEEEEEEEGGGQAGMPLRDHLAELRRRLIRIFLLALAGFLAAYPFGKEIYDLLLIPLLKVLPISSKLIYTSVPEAFFTYMKTAFLAGLFAASPLIFYQIWAFVAPGLYREEKAFLLPLAAVSAICFLGGGAFCFFLVFPLAFELFMSYTTDTVQAMPTLHEYLSFVLHLLVPFGLVFEMPLVSFFLSRLGLISALGMRRIRRYAVLIIFIVAAVLTPPDVFSQLLMAGPMLLLYEVSILIAALFGRPPKPADACQAPGGATAPGEN
ncbi:MAG: twin-arginine translocase subunit TatC [Desulfovibrio sp.]|nr:twin-arginine translocase subunit TatC [Desulfovibrio sp.]